MPNGTTGATHARDRHFLQKENQERREALGMEGADVMQREQKLEAGDSHRYTPTSIGFSVKGSRRSNSPTFRMGKQRPR